GSQATHVLAPGEGIADLGGRAGIDVDAIEDREDGVRVVDSLGVRASQLTVDPGQPRLDFRSAVELRDGRELVIEPGVIPRVGDVDERFQLADEILHESARRDGESHRRREIHALPLHLVLILSLYFSHGKTTADPPGTIAFRGLPEAANL